MKKYLTKRNIFFAVAILVLIVFALMFAFLPTPETHRVWYFDMEGKTFIRALLLPSATIFTSAFVHVGYFCGFVLSCTAFVVCLTWLLVNVYKQYRQEHPRKPSNKQRIAELERQIAELKQNQKD